MTRYVIEPTITPGEWMVVIDVPPPATLNIVFDGTAQQCIDYCEAQGAERRGPRVYIKE